MYLNDIFFDIFGDLCTFCESTTLGHHLKSAQSVTLLYKLYVHNTVYIWRYDSAEPYSTGLVLNLGPCRRQPLSWLWKE
jgi:hypothetical protein